MSEFIIQPRLAVCQACVLPIRLQRFKTCKSALLPFLHAKSRGFAFLNLHVRKARVKETRSVCRACACVREMSYVWEAVLGECELCRAAFVDPTEQICTICADLYTALVQEGELPEGLPVFKVLHRSGMFASHFICRGGVVQSTQRSLYAGY